MGDVVELDDYRPHTVATEQCDACGHRAIAVAPTTCPDDGRECAACHGMTARVVEWHTPNGSTIPAA